jgi:ArsR family transcriptional regulator, virulence genes transcriptional regulator
MKRNPSRRGAAVASAPQNAELKRNATRAAELLKAMSNPCRLMVLCSLAEGERSVGELERVVGLSQSALSQHLARLRHEKIVVARRSGQTVFYSLSGREATAVLETLYRVYCEPSSVAAPVATVTEPQPVL